MSEAADEFSALVAPSLNKKICTIQQLVFIIFL